MHALVALRNIMHAWCVTVLYVCRCVVFHCNCYSMTAITMNYFFTMIFIDIMIILKVVKVWLGHINRELLNNDVVDIITT